jgi:hypothetical protein
MIVQDALSSNLQLSISRSCSALEISRSGYCKWRKEKDAFASESSENVVLRGEIQGIAMEFPGYGYRRIVPEKEIHMIMHLLRALSRP